MGGTTIFQSHRAIVLPSVRYADFFQLLRNHDAKFRADKDYTLF